MSLLEVKVSDLAQQYRYFLTTIDNPFDPVDQQDSWLLFDELNNYKSNELLAKFAKTSDELSDAEVQEEIKRAIARIIAHDPLNIYVMVRKPMPKY